MDLWALICIGRRREDEGAQVVIWTEFDLLLAYFSRSLIISNRFFPLLLFLLKADQSVVLTQDTDSFIIGQRVWVGGIRPGHIAYIGETHFAPGEWAGVVLDELNGKNDGCVSGKRYFQCEPKRGIFSRLTRLTREPLSGGDDTFNRSMTTSPVRSGTVSPVPSSYSSYQNMMASTPRKSSSSKYQSLFLCPTN